MPQTEKQLTAVQSVIDLLEILKQQQLVIAESARDNNEPTAGCDGMYVAYEMAQRVAKEKLATERQQHLDTFVAGDERGTGNIPFNAEQYFEQTFKTQ